MDNGDASKPPGRQAEHESADPVEFETFFRMYYRELLRAAMYVGAKLHDAAVKMLGIPDYQVEENGPDHQKTFRAVVRVGGRELGSGAGRTKKAAEQRAAEAAWRAITQNTDLDEPETLCATETAAVTPA